MTDSAQLLQLAHQAGFELAGICDVAPPPHLGAYEAWIHKGYHASMTYLAEHAALKSDPRNLLPSAQSVLVVALNYGQIVERRPEQVKIARYALGRDYHKVVRGKLKQIENKLKSEFPGLETRVCVDSAPLMERDFAQLAGIGWFGKNTMIINSRRGSWFVLGFLLLSEQFEPSKPAEGGCGTCKACIEACPTGAIVFEEERWQVDARRCVSYLTIEHEGPIPEELAAGMGDWTFGCDICQEVCPFNAPRDSQPERAPTTSTPDFLRETQWPTLVEAAQIQEDRWDALTQGSPVRRAGLDGLRRNARINFENLLRR